MGRFFAEEKRLKEGIGEGGGREGRGGYVMDVSKRARFFAIVAIPFSSVFRRDGTQWFFFLLLVDVSFVYVSDVVYLLNERGMGGGMK